MADTTDHRSDTENLPERKSRRHVPLILAVAVAALVLGWEYRDALLGSGAFGLLLLFACLGMHFFMHRGHGGQGSGGPEQ